MGLDISLETRARYAANEAASKAWDDLYNEYHDDDGKYKEGFDDEKWDVARKLLPQHEYENGSTPSVNYPDHLFNRRYLRSSYNQSGFNHVVPDILGRPSDLYAIFEPVIGDDPEPYETILDETFVDKLGQVRENALQVARELRDADPLKAVTSSGPLLGSKDHQWQQLPSADEVLAWYKEERDRKREERAKRVAETDPKTLAKQDEFWGPDSGFISAKGEVFGFDKGAEILAITLGRNELAKFSAGLPVGTLGHAIGVSPEIVYIIRLSTEGKESYIQSAEIIAEFVDEALDLIKRDGSVVMSWSG